MQQMGSAVKDVEVISVEKATVLSGRLILDVRVDSSFPANTDPEIASLALRLRPTLADHACINGRGPAFGAVIAETSLPHLFEHLIIDEQARMADGGNRPEGNRPEGNRSSGLSFDSAHNRPPDLPFDGAHNRSRGLPSSPSPTFKGSTEWTDRVHGRARVQVSFEDDIVALAAVTRAQAILRRIFA